MSISMLYSVHPQPGRIFEAIASLTEARTFLEPHAHVLNQWRAEVAGPNTGTLYTVLNWDKPSDMAASQEAMSADPGFLAHTAKALGPERVILEAMPSAMVGFDVPGFPNMHLAKNTSGVRRVGGVITFHYSDELHYLLAGSQARAERYGYTWACRMWATGTGTAPIVAVYNVYDNRTAWGASQDRQLAEMGSDPVMRLVRPHLISRAQLIEVL
jgi:hypothetical protein